jgi:hypothetical protein
MPAGFKRALLIAGVFHDDAGHHGVRKLRADGNVCVCQRIDPTALYRPGLRR